MASANIVITQNSISGLPGKSRDDIVLGSQIRFSNANDNGVRSWRWVLISKPRFSSATLSNVVAAQPTLLPDVPGTYLVQLTVNEGLQGEVDRVEAVVRNVPVTVGAETFITRYIAAAEATEANFTVNFGAGPVPNTTGWWSDFDLWCRLIQALATSGVPSVSPWAAVLSDGNQTGTTAPVIDNEVPVVYAFSGFGAASTATNGLDSTTGVLTTAYDLPLFLRVGGTAGVGAALPIATLVQADVGGGDTQAEVEISLSCRVVVGATVTSLAYNMRARLKSDGGTPFASLYFFAGNFFRFSITNAGGALTLNYLDTVAADEVEAHGKVTVAASLK